MRRLLAALLFLVLAGCSGYTTRVEETGYRGRARVDAYLAATLLLQHYGYEASSRPGWARPQPEISMLVVPVSAINTGGFVQEMEDWVRAGGHLVCLGERGESLHNDWMKFYHPDEHLVPPAIGKWLESRGVELRWKEGKTLEEKQISVGSRRHEVFAESGYEVVDPGGRGHLFRTVTLGAGRISVLADARLLRNRYLDEHEHGALLLSLAEISPSEGSIVFIRNISMSFWGKVWERGWPALCALAVVILLWLWRNMPGFGPKLALDEPTQLRAYDHHLEALGDFHWRLDKAAGLLKPLRDSIFERGQQQASAAGHRDDNLFEWLGQRAGITQERAQRALTQDAPKDPATFARLLADLQALHLSLS